MGTELNTTQVALLEAIKASLFDTEPNYPADTDWDEVVKEAKVQTIYGLISPVIPVRDEITEHGKAHYIHLLYEQDKLIKLLDANDIPCVILKGSAAAIYYQKPFLRAMGDVDLLVPHDKFYEAVKVLEDNGYNYEHGKDENGNRPKYVRHFNYNKNGIEFELHHHFSSPGFDMDTILEHAIENREYHDLDGYKIPILPNITNGLVLLGHINQHLNNNNLGLRQMLDWEMYVHNVMNPDLWNEFIRYANDIGLDCLANNVTYICNKYFGLPYNIELTEHSEDVSGSFLRMLFDNGNFGLKASESKSQKNNRKAMQTVYSIKRYGFIKYFQGVGLSNLKTSENTVILKLFAWIYGLFWTIRKGIIANFKINNLIKQLGTGYGRHNLYKKMGVRTPKKHLK